MKKVILFLTIVILLSSCDLSMLKYQDKPFKETSLSNEKSDIIKFLILSDLHIGRDKEEKGFIDYSDKILSYVAEDEYAFALINGDLVDTSNQYEKGKAFISKLKLKMGNENVIYALGNHDTHYSDKEHWLEYNFGDKNHNAYHKYNFSGFSIYKLDSADRTLGYSQLLALEEALKKDNNEFKLLLSHVPLSGKITEATALQLTIASAEERNKIVSLMKKYKVGIYIAGHHHIGNNETHYDETTGSFILAAAHAINHFPPESTGFYYEGILDKVQKVLTIKAYNAKDNTLADTYIFNLP